MLMLLDDVVDDDNTAKIPTGLKLLSVLQLIALHLGYSTKLSGSVLYAG